MTNKETETARVALSRLLINTEQLLVRHGENHWAELVAESRRLIDLRDFHGVELIHSSFGGMGSFSDLTIHRLNGHQVIDEETDRVNDRLRTYQTQIYDLAHALSRHQRSVNR